MVYTLQALSEEDRRLWLDAMDGKEPVTPQLAARNPTLAVNIKFYLVFFFSS